MAKRQNFVVGSTNAVTQTMTPSELNHGFDQYEILTADELDGVFNAVSDFSNDSSNEIANAIQSITGSQPTGGSQTELANALQQMRNEIETTSLTFKGYVATSAPSSSTYALVTGNIWINAATMPTSFPVAASSIKQWDGSAWVNYGSTYTPADFDFFRNINDNEGYYWFGGLWTVMSTDMSTTYFTLNQSTGKWEIKSSVNLPGSPTTTTPDAADQSTKIATTQFAHDFGQRYVSNCITEIPQDINLELNNGTLTLKSGSKLYVPNGSGTFDILTLTADKTTTQTANDTRMYLYNGSYIEKFPLAQCYSGDAAPSGQTYMFWYDTANNLMKMTTDGGTTWTSGWSLPFCIATASGGALTRIDQVFNGFGYIGSTVFALPGVTGVAPNGYNTDGTLRNSVRSITTVQVITMVNTLTENRTFIVYNVGGVELVSGSMGQVWYDTDSNKLMWAGLLIDGFVCFDAGFTSGKVTSFIPKKGFRAVDYNESDFVVAFQRPTSTNNYTWYRLYKSGWVEQGGYLPATGSGDTLQTVNLPKAMSDAHYTVTTSITDATYNFAPDWYLVTVQQQTSTGFKTYTGSDWGKYWSVSGKASV